MFKRMKEEKQDKTKMQDVISLNEEEREAAAFEYNHNVGGNRVTKFGSLEIPWSVKEIFVLQKVSHLCSGKIFLNIYLFIYLGAEKFSFLANRFDCATTTLGRAYQTVRRHE
jgi:hypothetical protein